MPTDFAIKHGKKSLVLCDTNVIIEFYKRNLEVVPDGFIATTALVVGYVIGQSSLLIVDTYIVKI